MDHFVSQSNAKNAAAGISPSPRVTQVDVWPSGPTLGRLVWPAALRTPQRKKTCLR